MNTSFDANKEYLVRELTTKGLEVTPEAWRPLKRIDFNQLVQIHDHEEAFLRGVFVESLQTAHRMRTASASGTRKVNARDVTTAMLMLGAAIASANESLIAASNKALVKSICPYC